MAYSFALDSFRISGTRSPREDTDYVSISLAVGTAAPITKVKSMGDLDNGTYKPGLSIDNIAVEATTRVVFNYAIINNGHGPRAKVEQALQLAGTRLARKTADAASKAVGAEVGSLLGTSLGTAAVPVVGTALDAVSGWLVGEIGSMLFGDCDGAVAAGIHVFTGAELASMAANRKVMTQTDHNPGIDVSHGCGRSSNYYVTCSVRSA
jgi:hypothetical protein